MKKQTVYLAFLMICLMTAGLVATDDLTGTWKGVGSLSFKDQFILTLQTSADQIVGAISTASGSIENAPLQDIAWIKNTLLFSYNAPGNRLVRVSLLCEGERLHGMSFFTGGEWRPMELIRTSKELPLAVQKTDSPANKSSDTFHEFPRQEISLTDFRAEGYVLDIGGGGAGVIGQIKPSQVVAIDLFKQELEDAATGPLKVVMDATDLKFIDRSFSTATCFFTFMYMNEYCQEKSFCEVRRVLAPKGRFLVWDVILQKKQPNDENFAVFPFSFTLPKGQLIETGYGVRWPPKAHDLTYYKSLAEKTGFRVVAEKTWPQAFFLELESTAKPSLAHLLSEALKDNGGNDAFKTTNPGVKSETLGVDAIRKTHAKITAARGEYEVDSQSIDRLGKKWLEAGMVAEAIAVFEINVQEFPGLCSSFDSLAGAYLKAGNKKLAIENYEKALKLDPGNKTVKTALDGLKAANS